MAGAAVIIRALGICVLAAGLALAWPNASAHAQEGAPPVEAPKTPLPDVRNTPFGYGEDVADLTASCEDIRDWAAKAPKTDMRVTLYIRGKLARMFENPALVMLEMCGKPTPKVTCVTYSRNGMSAGDVVSFAGGYRQIDEERIVLDPCLASRK